MDTARAPVIRILHLSDIHCGRPFVQAHVDAALAMAREDRWNAIVMSGDFSQRARTREFEAARALVDRFQACAPVITVPGNHDAAWWHSPFGFGDFSRVHEQYRTFINRDTAPTVRVPGVTMVGVNSAWGTRREALTWYPRDWRVKGGLSDAQLRDAATRLADAPPGDLRLLVVHHNVIRGKLSNRWGLKQPQRVLDALATMPVDVVCTGHDHEERAEIVQRHGRQFLVSAANTLSSRMRGHRPSALNVIEATADRMTVTAWSFDRRATCFAAGPVTATLPREVFPSAAHR